MDRGPRTGRYFSEYPLLAQSRHPQIFFLENFFAPKLGKGKKAGTTLIGSKVVPD